MAPVVTWTILDVDGLVHVLGDNDETYCKWRRVWFSDDTDPLVEIGRVVTCFECISLMFKRSKTTI
jgi:hypothetical protein